MSHDATNWAVKQRGKNPKWLWDLTDGHCAYCGVIFMSPRQMTVDHLVPKSRGGGDEKSNKFPCCKSCNSIKHNRPLEYLRLALHREFTGIPHFTAEQIEYLSSVGIALPKQTPFVFYWERMGNTFDEAGRG